MGNKPTGNKKAPTTASSVSAWLFHGSLFTVLWCLLAQGSANSLVIGIAAVPVATWCAINLFPVYPRLRKPTIRFLAAVSLFPFFVVQSVKGGWLSAKFALLPKWKVNPAIIKFETSLPPGRPRLFFTNLISILPGTISAGWRDNQIWVHVLDIDADNFESLRICESKIAILFGIEKTI